MKKNILFVHQSADLYGSDKTLLILVRGLDRKRFTPIVLLPHEGPLAALLRGEGVEVHAIPLVKLAQNTLKLTGLLALPGEILASLSAMNGLLAGREIHVVHTNTLAVLGGALWARWHGVPHVWHVHEIITRPRIAEIVYPFLVRALANNVSCNSTATRQTLVTHQPRLASRSTVIWNGLDRVEPPNPVAAQKIRESLGLDESTLLVTLMGRINRWKGQLFLAEVAAALREQQGAQQLHFLMVGSPPDGQEHFKQALIDRIGRLGLSGMVSVMAFQKDIWPVWDATDIAVVPSTEPEPFGMVALEAMLAGKPVIASACGGLVDIIEDRESGLLLAPGNIAAWCQGILELANDSAARQRMGAAANQRAIKLFSTQAYVSAFESLYEGIVRHDQA